MQPLIIQNSISARYPLSIEKLLIFRLGFPPSSHPHSFLLQHAAALMLLSFRSLTIIKRPDALSEDSRATGSNPILAASLKGLLVSLHQLSHKGKRVIVINQTLFTVVDDKKHSQTLFLCLNLRRLP